MKILLVRLGAMGDIVHALPAMAAMRRAWPDARIDWLVDRRHRALLDLVLGLDARVVVDLKGRWAELPGTLWRLRRQQYDVALDLQGLIKSAALARAAGARRVVGFPRPLLREPGASVFHTETADVPPGLHVVRKNLAALGALGLHDPALEFPIVDRPAPAWWQDGWSHEPVALVNPGAAWPNKRWPPARFGELAAWMRDRYRLRSAVLWGPGEEGLAAAVVATSRGAARQLPRTSLGDLVAIARRARLMVAGDTGPLHLAAAVGLPVVGLYGPTSPERNGPWAPPDVTLSRFAGCACHYRRQCRRTSACLDGIALDEVARAVEHRLHAAALPAC